MKKLVVMALVAAFAFSGTIEARDQNRGGKQDDRPAMKRWSAKERAENMQKELELTADQKTKVEALFEAQDTKREEQMAQHKEMKEEMTKDAEKRREEMKALREKELAESDAALEAIIGKEKIEQWKKIRAERQKEARGKGRPEGRPPR